MKIVIEINTAAHFARTGLAVKLVIKSDLSDLYRVVPCFDATCTKVSLRCRVLP